MTRTPCFVSSSSPNTLRAGLAAGVGTMSGAVAGPRNQYSSSRNSGWRSSGKAWQAADEKGLKDAQQRGQSIETVSGSELERWRSMLKLVPEEWLKKAQQKGLDGRKMLDDLEAMIKAASS